MGAPCCAVGWLACWAMLGALRGVAGRMAGGCGMGWLLVACPNSRQTKAPAIAGA